MNKSKLIAVLLSAIVASVTPALITRAGADPATPSPAAPASAIRLRITAYSSTEDQTDDTPFITASGSFVHDGVVATNLLPFGTKVSIPALFGDKVFVVEDRMNTRYQKTIDVWMPSTAKALRFGVRHADVVIVDRPDPLVLQ